jgi:hypothetical protein
MHWCTKLLHNRSKHFSRVKTLCRIINVLNNSLSQMSRCNWWSQCWKLMAMDNVPTNSGTLDNLQFVISLKTWMGRRKLHQALSQNNLNKEQQQWHKYATANFHLECYHNEGDAFLHITVLGKTLALQLNQQHHLGSTHLKEFTMNPVGSNWCSLWLQILIVSSSTIWSQWVGLSLQTTTEHLWSINCFQWYSIITATW